MNQTLAFTSEDITPMVAELSSLQSVPITEIYNVNEWFIEIRKKITEIAKLTEGWDTYGSQPLTLVAKIRALDLALRLQLTSLQWINLPFVAPISGGGIQFSWKLPNRELEIEIFHDGTIEYLLIDEDGEHEGEIENTRGNRVLNIVGQFTHTK